MKIPINTSNFTGNGLRIGCVISLFIGASLIIPKIADAAGNLNHMAPKYSSSESQDSLGEYKADFQDSSNGYEPPDFGHPMSAYGSGTR